MPANVALLVYVAAIAALLWLDFRGSARPSPAIWISVAWVILGASRPVLAWFGPGGVSMDISDGSPIDRFAATVLLVAALFVLARRADRTWNVVRANPVILLFFVYCAFSVLWADYSFVAFKRWTKALGNVAVVLVVLTDSKPTVALKWLLSGAGIPLLGLSLCMIKDFPYVGRGYDGWTGSIQNLGVTEGKNLLGVICLVFGLASVWRLVDAFRQPASRTRQLIVHGVVLALVCWLLRLAGSATSLACLILGGLLIPAVTLAGGRRATGVNVVLGGTALAGLFAFLVLDGYGYAVEALGRDATLTGRTELWEVVLGMNADPFLGAGFESFFLGARAERLHRMFWWAPNQAHNGYIEILLTLGWIGIVLLVLQMAVGYRNILRVVRSEPALGAFRAAVFASAIIYNVTETAFKVRHPMWILFLLAIMAVPEIAAAPDAARRVWHRRRPGAPRSGATPRAGAPRSGVIPRVGAPRSGVIRRVSRRP